jgi:saccharopine dehydrogenase (NADP+, L-glutamate forming)
MATILIIGGGKSSSYLINFLAHSCLTKERSLLVADLDVTHLNDLLKSRKNTEVRGLNIFDDDARKSLIDAADLVISMLPAKLHPIIAKECLLLGKHFFSASYESEEMKNMKEEIEKKGLFFLNECGLDPGIDHMSAMRIIDKAKTAGEKIISFKSYCGGLLAPESEDNPWKYKFTWNPRNVVLAGQGTSRYLENNELKIVPYHQLFRRLDQLSFDKLGDFEGYPNRDSLSYREIYGLESVHTILRGTLRRAGYCKAWDVFVQLGMCEDSIQLDLSEGTTQRQFLNSFLPYDKKLSVEEKLGNIIPNFDFDTWEKIQWLGFFSETPLLKWQGSPAAILQSILEKNWSLSSEDKDMIVMQHQFEIETDKGNKKITSSLVIFGEDSTYTAMAKTVGFPLAIAADSFLDGKINLVGLHLPVIPEIYTPILETLAQFGIIFHEKSS